MLILSEFAKVLHLHTFVSQIVRPAKKISTRLTAILVALVMVLLVLNKAVFLHSHRLSNGVVISHAHPFS